MTNLAVAKQKILDKLPPDLVPIMEMYLDFYEEILTEQMATNMLRDCNVLGQHHFNRIHINDLKAWALTQQNKLKARSMS